MYVRMSYGVSNGHCLDTCNADSYECLFISTKVNDCILSELLSMLIVSLGLCMSLG